jgi:hypothetical protein
VVPVSIKPLETTKESEKISSTSQEANYLLPVGKLIEHWVSRSPQTPEGLLEFIRSRIVAYEDVGEEAGGGQRRED